MIYYEAWHVPGGTCMAREMPLVGGYDGSQYRVGVMKDEEARGAATAVATSQARLHPFTECRFEVRRVTIREDVVTITHAGGSDGPG